MELASSSIAGCRAMDYGGGLFALNSAASVASSAIRANIAAGSAGAHFRMDRQWQALSTVNLINAIFEDNNSTDRGDPGSPDPGSAILVLHRTRKGHATNVTFRGNSGEHTIVRRDALGPKWLCQPGHYMPIDPDLLVPMQADFTDCERFPCARAGSRNLRDLW